MMVQVKYSYILLKVINDSYICCSCPLVFFKKNEFLVDTTKRNYNEENKIKTSFISLFQLEHKQLVSKGMKFHVGSK